MSFIVEMARGKPGESSHETFSCSGAAWKDLLEIAARFGWEPEGAVHDEATAKWTRDYDKHFQPNYEPEEWLYCKRLTDSDARALSEALLRAQSTPDPRARVAPGKPSSTLLRDDLTVEEYERVNSSAAQLISVFADFCSRGGFAFAWDD